MDKIRILNQQEVSLLLNLSEQSSRWKEHIESQNFIVIHGIASIRY